MSSIRTGLTALSLAAGAWLSLPVTAAPYSYTCDNDRSASQYPDCYNRTGTGFAYRSGQRGSYHGDDRLARTNAGYVWGFKWTNSYYFQAWLANAAFTDPRVEYWVYADGFWRQMSFINQNTAPSGWNYIGYRRGRELMLKRTSGIGAAGADAVRIRTVDAAQAEIAAATRSSPCASLMPTGAELRALQQRMLDSAHRYGTAAGTYRIRFGNNGQRETVDFEVSQNERASYVRVTGHDGTATEFVSDGRSMLTLHPQRASYALVELAPDVQEEPSTPRVYRDAACDPVYVHRADPAGAAAAADVLAPANYAFWLSQPGSRIVGKDRLLGRSVTVAAGRHDPVLARKLGAATYTMWVDDRTGTLLRLVGQGTTGRRAYAIEVEGISFDLALPMRIKLQAPAHWTRIGEH